MKNIDKLRKMVKNGKIFFINFCVDPNLRNSKRNIYKDI